MAAHVDLEKIAKMASVSRSTVSRVVNDQADVSPEVRQRVKKIIQETGFQPNLAARSLRNKQTDIIGLVICNTMVGLFTDPYFAQLNLSISQTCYKYNKTLALYLEGEPDTIFPRLTRRGLMDGILLQAGKMKDSLLKKMLKTDIPFVYLGRPTESGVSYVDIDNVTGAHLATSHLISMKHKRIAAICGDLDTTTGADRHEGYTLALREEGIPYQEELVGEGDFSEISGYQAMLQLLNSKPNAVFAANDMMARGAIRAIQEAGLSIPHDVAVVGFDDLPPAVSASPLLTTVRQPINQMGASAVEMLFDVIQHGSQPVRHTVLDVELIIRESSG
ncbi:MAG: LacI family DNA-binding transcriptional regulator [Anaerolineaceae bacterium]|nr:LacI family DNA-binding transcriptional regulator [Anaerolineaceae bacterium]MBN2677271.1 LacI family DNA-binding transcriptional regulator [Anaerolineaceae bacterium]